MNPFKVLAIVPAYNEATNIANVIAQLRTSGYVSDIVVVNDGSKDNTARAATIAGGRVLTLPYNLGIGGAVQTGLIYACDNGYDAAVQVDGDGQHPANQLPLILDPVRNGDADVAIGSRFLGSKGFKSSFTRRMGIFVFRTIVSLAVSQKITDNTSGFRAYNKRAIAFLAQNYPCDYPEVEAVVVLKRNGFRLLEVPVVMEERHGGTSSITPIRSLYYMIKVLLAVIISVLRAPEPRYGKD